VVQLVSDGVAGEQVSFQVSSESVNRWRCSNGVVYLGFQTVTITFLYFFRKHRKFLFSIAV